LGRGWAGARNVTSTGMCLLSCLATRNRPTELTNMNRKKQNLLRFEADLKAIMRDYNNLRPFVCEGSPLECQAFIVGSNPATDLKNPFWPFWETGSGFVKARWFEAYKKHRQTKPHEPGKRKRAAISPTRQRIDWICEAAAPVKCLETNVYSRAASRLKDLEPNDRRTELFDFLLKQIRPKVVLVHSEDAEQHVRGLSISAHIISVDPLFTCRRQEPRSWASKSVGA